MTRWDRIAFLVNCLEQCQIEYVIGGSIASTIWGYARSTRDVDLAIQVTVKEQMDALAHLMGEDYILFPRDWTQLLETLDPFPCGEISHVEGGWRCALFLVRSDPYVDSQFERARNVEMLPESYIRVASPEDVVLFKLRWFELGGRVSDRQWTDIQEVLEVQDDLFDVGYLDHWLRHFGVEELWEAARAEWRCDRLK